MSERSYLSIGQVVNLLRNTYPDLSNSKIRFLEDEGLITPHRTPKGYRQYSKEDVNRLEVILHLQKTRYMPLNVIKTKLDNAESLDALAIEVGLLSNEPIKDSPQESVAKLHPIDEIPDLVALFQKLRFRQGDLLLGIDDLFHRRRIGINQSLA